MVAVVAAGEGHSLLVVNSAISMGGGGMGAPTRSFCNFLGGGCAAPGPPRGLAGGMKTSSASSPAKGISRRVTMMVSLHPMAAHDGGGTGVPAAATN